MKHKRSKAVAESRRRAHLAKRHRHRSRRVADDYAAANLGQLKHLATQAALQMNTTLPGSAGSQINALIDSWQAPPAPSQIREKRCPK